MKTLILSILLLITVATSPGCARLSSTVTEAKDLKTTHVTVSTLWSSKSDLAKFATGQTDKSQRIAIGSLSQEATDTNMVNIIRAVTDGAVNGAIRATVRP